MSQDLLTQLAEYGAYCDELQSAVPSDEIVVSISPILSSDQPEKPRRLWLVGVAAAAFVLVALGGVAWLAQFGGQSPPATEEPVLTTGDGPKLSFIQAEPPTGDLLGDGVWFKGAMYALAWSTTDLYRTTDGFTWEQVATLPEVTWDVRRSMLQTDGERLVNVVMPADGVIGIRDGAFIQISSSTDGDDWTSSTIRLPVPPVPAGSHLAGEFQLGENFWTSDNFAVGPRGIVVTATISLRFVVDGLAMELTGIADNNEGTEPEVVDLDIDRGVMTVQLWDTEDGTRIGEVQEIDLKAAGFSTAVSNVLDAMVADPDWAPVVPGFIAQLNYEFGDADVSVGHAWFTPDGETWQRVGSAGPLDGGEFAGIVATNEGFVATASSTFKPDGLPSELRHLSESFNNDVVWRSADGTTWTEAAGLASGHDTSDTALARWQGELVELVGWVHSVDDDMRPMTLAEQQQAMSDIPTQGMWLNISDFGLIGIPSSGWAGPDATELLFSADGTDWNRWEPTEFGLGGSHDSQDEHMGDISIVGAGGDFVVVQHQVWDEETQRPVRTLWVGTIE